MVSRRGLWSIPPNAAFLPILVDKVLDGTLLSGWDRTGPFWLADVTIILPTRRARLHLAELFATRLGGAALLPDIRTFGGEPGEEEPFLPPIDAPVAPPAASLIERRLVLSRLVAALRAAGAEPVSYVVTNAGHSAMERENALALTAVMDGLPPLVRASSMAR